MKIDLYLLLEIESTATEQEVGTVISFIVF